MNSAGTISINRIRKYALWSWIIPITLKYFENSYLLFWSLIIWKSFLEWSFHKGILFGKFFSLGKWPIKLKDTYNDELEHLQLAFKQKRPESGKHSSNTGVEPFENVHVELIVFFAEHVFDVAL